MAGLDVDRRQPADQNTLAYWVPALVVDSNVLESFGVASVSHSFVPIPSRPCRRR